MRNLTVTLYLITMEQHLGKEIIYAKEAVLLAIQQVPGKGSVNVWCECIMSKPDQFKLILLEPSLTRYNLIFITGCELGI